MRKWILRVVLGVVGLFVLAQLVPYGRNHTNPPAQAEPRWASAQTRQLAARACFDCHSNLTKWPWYSNIAPGSWLIYQDTMGGRSALNFTEWNRPQDGAGDAVNAIQSGSMPPWYYVLLHPRARLSQSEKNALMAGLTATFGNSPPIAGGG